MNELWQRIVAGAEQIGSVVPALVGAVVILITGYFLARQVQRWADDTLKRLDFNRVAAAGGLDEVVGRTGSRLDPVRALAKLIFWLVMLVVILLASTALGLESINQMFGTMLAFIPTLIAGIVIVILGMILGEFVRGLIHSDGCRSVNRFKTKLPSGRVAEYAYPRWFFSKRSEAIRAPSDSSEARFWIIRSAKRSGQRRPRAG